MLLFPTLATWLTVLVSFAPSQAEEGPRETPKEEVRARTTVLHLSTGTVLRTRARETAEGWEVESGGEWQILPSELVVRAKSEHELLAQAQKLERALPKDDLVRRVAYADWLLGEGLLVEGLRQLDRVLERSPDQADAVTLLAGRPLPLALPPAPQSAAGLEALFAAAGRLSPAGREVAVQRLRGETEIPGLRAALARELVARVSGRRAFAALALRRLFPGSEAEGLLARAVLDASPEVRVGAARSLKAFEDPAVIVPAVRAIGSRYPEVRVHAIEALATMEYREAVEPLYNHLVALQSGGGTSAPRVHIFTGRQRAYIQDFDVEVAQNAAIADPVINTLIEGEVLDVAVIGSTEYQVAAERSAVRRALAQLTGAKPGETTTAWTEWWQEHGDEWRAAEPPPKAPTSPAGQG
jgi:hypothetical protein